MKKFENKIFILLFLILYTNITYKLTKNTVILQNFFEFEQYFTQKKVISKLIDYSQLDSKYSTIYYKNVDEEFVFMINRTLNHYYEILLKDFYIDSNNLKKLKVIVYNDLHELETNTGSNYDGKLPMGVYFSGIINILSPKSWINTNNSAVIIDKFLEEGPIVHELAHYFLDIKTKGNYEKWFSEGLALFYENKYTSYTIKDTSLDTSDIDIDMLRHNFHNINTTKAYKKSYEIIKNFIFTHDEETLQNLIHK